MAGQTTGTIAHPSRILTAAQLPQQLHLVAPATTRTRRNHGMFTLGGQLAGVYSTRRGGQCYGVSFELGAGTLSLNSSMTPAQARQMARALLSAAAAVETAQQLATEGGAA